MLPRVTAILVARQGGAPLERTLAALRGQTRRPDALVAVDAGSSARLADELSAAAPTSIVSARGASLASALTAAVQALPASESNDDWLWLLADDTAPAADALEALLAAVEVAPSVAIAGPKLVDPDDPAMLRSYGVSVTRWGASIPLVENELDQAQHDRVTDVLGVESGGMLVRRPVLAALGGLDPGLPHVDAALDLSVRARLAGHRVIRVPRARVARVRPPEDAARRSPSGPAARRRAARIAQLHRRLVWAPALAVPLHWLSLGPVALARAVGQLLAKRPEAVVGELTAALRAALDPTVPAARARLRRARRLGWSAIAPLRVPPAEVRERRAAERDRRAEEHGQQLEIARAGFASGGGLALVIGAAILGLAAAWRLVGAEALVGGALRPLGATVPELWSSVVGASSDGVLGWAPADPFSAVLASLGTLSFWNPSLSMVALWLAAVPLAAFGAWWCATRVSERALPPFVAGMLWALAAPLFAALADGRPGGVLAHVLLPWLVFAVLEAGRSWSAAAGGALLFAAVIASSPSLAPGLTGLLVVAAVLRPRSALRVIGIPVLGLVAFLPLAAAQLAAGNPLGLLADPGLPAGFAAPSGWELLLARPAAGIDGWSELLTGFGAPGTLGILIPAALAAPLAVAALLAVFLPGARKAIPALVVALVGLATAVVAAHLTLAADGALGVGPWPGAGLSLYWLGLIGAALAALEALRPAAALGALVLVVAAALGAAPAVAALALGDEPTVRPSGAVLPALVVAEAGDDPSVGTLVLEAQHDGSIGARLERGAGTSLEALSTLETTRLSGDVSDETRRMAELAGNLASFGGFDAAPVFAELGIGYVLVPSASSEAAATAQRVTESLDATVGLEPIGETSAGTLWRVVGERAPVAAQPPLPGLAVAVLAVQGAVLLVTVLLALPTGPRRRVVDPSALPGDDPADTFAEDENA